MCPERLRLDRRAGPGGYPDADEGPAVGEYADAVDEVLAADRIDDDVCAARAGQLAGAFDEAAGRVVDPVLEPERLQPFELLVAGRGRDHGRARALGELNRGHPDTAGSGVDQNGLARGEVAGGEQALMRGSERDRHARRAR